MTEQQNDLIMNLGMNLSGFLDGNVRKSMPVTEQEWDLCREWEVENNCIGSLTFYMHVEPF